MKIDRIQAAIQAGKPLNNTQLTKLALKHAFISRTQKAVKSQLISTPTQTTGPSPGDASVEAMGIFAQLLVLIMAGDKISDPAVQGLLKQLKALLPEISTEFPQLANSMQSVITAMQKGTGAFERAIFDQFQTADSTFNTWINNHLSIFKNIKITDSTKLGFDLAMLVAMESTIDVGRFSGFSTSADNNQVLAQFLAAYIFQAAGSPQEGLQELKAFQAAFNQLGEGGDPGSFIKDFSQIVQQIGSKSPPVLPSNWPPIKFLFGDFISAWDGWINGSGDFQ